MSLSVVSTVRPTVGVFASTLIVVNKVEVRIYCDGLVY